MHLTLVTCETPQPVGFSRRLGYHPLRHKREVHRPKIFFSGVGVSYCIFSSSRWREKRALTPASWPILKKCLNPSSLMKSVKISPIGTRNTKHEARHVQGSRFSVALHCTTLHRF